MVIYTDGLMEARIIDNWPGYAHLEWLYPGEQSWRMYRSFRRLEHILQAQGFRGWLAQSELDHSNMHRHITKTGAREFARDSKRAFFLKEFKARAN